LLFAHATLPLQDALGTNAGGLGYLERRPDPDDLSAIVATREAVDEVEVAWAHEFRPDRSATCYWTSTS
jgi:hypothetical protein